MLARRCVAALTALAIAGAVGAGPAQAGPTAAKKRPHGCAALKTKKQRNACQNRRRSGKYKKGLVCSLGRKKQAEYRTYGFVCIDVSARQDGSLTFLDDLS